MSSDGASDRVAPLGPPSEPAGPLDETSDELPSEVAASEVVPGAGENDKNNDVGEDDVKRYTKEELLRIRLHPLSMNKPECMSKPGHTAYSCWAVNKRVSESADDDRNKDLAGDKRRSGDPRERIRKENEGIVLSPQRRSFNSGCFVMSGHGSNTRLRPDSPLDQKSDIGSRDNTRRIGSGRILAREIAPPWERSEEDTLGGSGGGTDYNIYRPPGAQRDRGDDRFERRSYGMYGDKNRNDRDRDMGDNRYGDRKDRDDMRRGNRYNDKRRAYDKEDEPEWFSGGPTSQNETIELRGFDDPVATSTSASTTASSTSTTTSSNNNASITTTTSTSNTNVAESTNSNARPTRRTAGSGRTPSAVAANQAKETHNVEELYKVESNNQKEKPSNAQGGKEEENQNSNMEATYDYLNSLFTNDSILDVIDFNNLDNMFNNRNSPKKTSKENSGNSKFCRWFKSEGREGQSGSSPKNESNTDQGISDHMLNNIINDLETSISIPNNESQHVFAPISPAASTAPVQNSLLEILQRGQKMQSNQPHLHQSHMPYQQKSMENMPVKIHNLEELEARMRGGSSHPPVQQQHQQMPRSGGVNHQQQQQQPQDDSVAFKKLLEQMFEGQAVSASNGPIMPHHQPQPMSILQIEQMLNKSQQADQAAMDIQHHQHHSQQPMSHELIKLLQVQQNHQQQENMSKIMPNMTQMNQPYQISPIPNEMNPHVNNISREILQRPEAQAIIHGLKQGEITPQHLMQQMANPGVQPRQRDAIATILNSYQQQQQMASPRTRLIPPQPQQQLRISPLPGNAFCVSPILATSPNTLAVHHPAIPQRIPSPRELQVHTQSIMQGALIKKKLEEQRENFRRRQEQSGPMIARTTTPAPVLSPKKHPSAIAFTPTSVLRKMTAEKESEHSIPKAIGWGAPTLIAQQNSLPKHARPIVKGNSTGMPVSPYQTAPDYPAAQYLNQQQQQFANNLQQQQQAAAAAARPKIQGHQSHHQFHAMVMQMHRQQHQQSQNPQHQPQMQSNNRGAPITGGANASLQQMLSHPHHRNHNDGTSIGPALSPTSNQLARWFSPELLAKASAGKLPSVNMAPNVMSLEELERMQHNEAIVHN